MRSKKPILLIEDDLIDVMTVNRVFDELNIKNDIIHKQNGEEAIKYLQSNNHESPCIILLDLNMPVMNGIEFLEEAKNDDELKKIPVIVLTTSNDERDVAESYELGAAGYMIKTAEYRDFVSTIKEIESYWTLSELPD